MGVPNLGELLIILFIVLLVFGAAKMPALGEALGRAVHNLRRSVAGPGAGRPPASKNAKG
ncbi:twin-arginine translocase TatA/TatE family subunit [Vulgatibacter sp.]|uniref:twin-arginine translocase TatA/TatE family subunit n=1 Tax=Vulgatibacter sp. TaxID=1971226 RepID=UPI003561D070